MRYSVGKTKKSKSNYLVQGTILVIASFVARFIGLVYRIPLTNILGDEGNAYYSTANEIYSILLMISSFSLPLAVSKLVSERLHMGQVKNAHKVFRCSIKFACLAGGIISILTFACAGLITKYLMSYELAVYALRVLSPAIFIFAIAGAFRGYFQGHETMVPTATSQVIEQIVNAIVTVIGAGIMMNYGIQLGKEQSNTSLGPAFGAAGGTFGTVVSVLVALFFLVFIYISYRRNLGRLARRDTTKRLESDKVIYRALLLTIIPVVLSTVVYNIGSVLDQGVFNKVLAGQGYTAKQYGTIWGIYSGKFRVLMNVPLAIASCLGPSVVPSLSADMMDKNYKGAGEKVRNSIRYTMVITIPCAVGMASLASPIMQLLFGDDRALTAGIMQSGALMIVLFALSTLTTSILQGIGEMQTPLVNSGIALGLHLVVLYVLLKVFVLNIYSVIYANIFFALIISILNAAAIRKHLRYRQEIKRTFIVPLICSGIMGLVAWGIYSLFHLFAGNAIPTFLGIIVGVVVYGVLLVKLRGVTEKELLRMPKGQLMVDLLRKCRVL